MNNVVFRVDASVAIGTGHLMRCLTLAEELLEKGVKVLFICRPHSGHLIDFIQRKAIPVIGLPPSASGGSEDGYASWLGAAPVVDAQQTINALDGKSPDWLVVDHYGIDYQWERILKPHVGKLMVIDDLANRLHQCDLLLDQNYAYDAGERYFGKIPDSCAVLLGPGYALLRPEYLQYRSRAIARSGKIGRVLVFFGGSDPLNMTELAVEALSSPELQNLRLEVVVGANYPFFDQLQQRISRRGRATLHRNLPHLAELMSDADIAVGAGGSTTWERMCLGLPAVVVSIAENQEKTCELLHQAGLIVYLGAAKKLALESLRDKMIELLAQPASVKRQSEAVRQWVDGCGTMRVVERLFAASN